MINLFSPIKFNNLTLPNRIILPPMCQYLAKDGFPQSWHLMHYGSIAVSGPGLIIIEATAVEPRGQITKHCLGLWSDGHQKAFAELVGNLKSLSNTPIGVQLAHSGRKGSITPPWAGDKYLPQAQGGWVPLAPSAKAYQNGFPAPIALDEAGINKVRENFTAAAARAGAAGLDLVEVHCAHGYLLHEFLSPITNQRTDNYGGSLENRMRLPLEVFDKIRKAFPAERPVGVRISATDWIDGGWDVEQSITFAKELQKRGCAFIHVSSGGLDSSQKIVIGPGYQAPLAAEIRKALKNNFGEKAMPVIAVGLITDPVQAETIIASGQADLVAVGRAMMYDPRWVWHAAAALGCRVAVPKTSYLRAAPHIFKNLFDPS